MWRVCLSCVRLGAMHYCTPQTPLHWAVFAGCSVTVDVLLEMGANATTPDKNGRTPAHVAVAKGVDGILQLLIQAGAFSESDPCAPRTHTFTHSFSLSVQQRTLLQPIVALHRGCSHCMLTLHTVCVLPQTLEKTGPALAKSGVCGRSGPTISRPPSACVAGPGPSLSKPGGTTADSVATSFVALAPSGPSHLGTLRVRSPSSCARRAPKYGQRKTSPKAFTTRGPLPISQSCWNASCGRTTSTSSTHSTGSTLTGLGSTPRLHCR